MWQPYGAPEERVVATILGSRRRLLWQQYAANFQHQDCCHNPVFGSPRLLPQPFFGSPRLLPQPFSGSPILTLCVHFIHKMIYFILVLHTNCAYDYHYAGIVIGIVIHPWVHSRTCHCHVLQCCALPPPGRRPLRNLCHERQGNPAVLSTSTVHRLP